MSTEFYPEIHDIGKLADRKQLNNDPEITTKFSAVHPFKDKEEFYDFTAIDLQNPNNLSWKGAQYHHNFNNIQETLNPEEWQTLFLLCFSDHLASAVSRSIARDLKKRLQKEEKLEGKEPLLKLWNLPYKRSFDLPIKNKKTLEEALRLVQANPSRFMDEDKYRKALLNTPEDKMPLLNLTTLHTHCELVGKIYRFLEANTRLIEKSGKKYICFAGGDASTIGEAEEKWKFTLVTCQVSFPQRPVRTRDLNIIHLQYCLIEELKKDANLLLSTSDTMWFVFPESANIKDEMQKKKLSPFWKYGFYFEFHEKDYSLKESVSPLIVSGSTEISPLDWRSIYAQDIEDGKDTFSPPMCDVCQMGRGDFEETYLEEESVTIIEHLCQKCRDIRKEERFGRLDDWEKQNPGARIAWVRVLLDTRLMEKRINELFGKKVQERIQDTQLQKEAQRNFRNIPLMADFVKDYFELAEEFAREVARELGVNDLEDETAKDSIMFLGGQYKDFFIVNLPDGKFIQQMIDIFLQKMRSEEVGFSACLDNSPIQLRISTSRVKYPFFEHLDYLQVNEEEETPSIVTLTRLPGVKVNVNPAQFIFLKELDLLGSKKGRTFLHKLADIESRTDSLLFVRAELLDERDSGEIRQLKKKLLEIDKKGSFSISTLLNYFKIIGWERKYDRSGVLGVQADTEE